MSWEPVNEQSMKTGTMYCSNVSFKMELANFIINQQFFVSF